MHDDGFQQLVAIVARLRGEGGCPWDRAQTPATLRPYVLEEAYEVLDAIDRDDHADLQKELGDVFFQLVLISQMAKEYGWFELDDVLAAINEKMVVRHPHVFDPAHQSDGDEGAVSAWEARKAKEHDGERSALDGVPGSLPALLRAHRISEKAGVVGFDWPDVAGVRKKLDEELTELDQALATGDDAQIAEELGDVLFTLVNLGRHLPVGAEEALRSATGKFEMRFRRLESDLQAEGGSVHQTAPEELERRWRQAKSDLC